MNGNKKLLFQKSIQIFYPAIDLTGKKELITLNNPFFGLQDIQFQPGSVFVKTAHSDEFEDIIVTVYEGIPNAEDITPEFISASGLIEVGEEGLVLGAGGSKEAVFQWQEGLTDVLVMVKISEVSNNQIRSITIYIKHFKTISFKKSIAHIFQRKFQTKDEKSSS